MFVDDNPKVAPISPAEAEKAHRGTIPDSIINAFNKLIVKHYKPISKEAVVKQDEVLDMVCGDPDSGKLKRADVFSNHWLDVEDIYREQGWNVEYDKPTYNETYDAYFVFSVKK